MLICIQCSMKAMVEHQPPPSFDETTEEHRLRVHPDPVETQRERRELEAKLSAWAVTSLQFSLNEGAATDVMDYTRRHAPSGAPPRRDV